MSAKSYDPNERFRPDPAEEANYREELDRHNRMSRSAAAGRPVPMIPEAGAEDAIAYLKGMPPDEAIASAREWTGRNDIETVEQAVSAVEASLTDRGE